MGPTCDGSWRLSVIAIWNLTQSFAGPMLAIDSGKGFG